MMRALGWSTAGVLVAGAVIFSAFPLVVVVLVAWALGSEYRYGPPESVVAVVLMCVICSLVAHFIERFGIRIFPGHRL